ATQTIKPLYTGGKVAISPDENLLITTIGDSIEVTDLQNGKKVLHLSGDSELITTFATTPDGNYIVTSSRSLVVKIWDFKTGQIKKSFKAHEAPIIVMDIDPTSSLVATGSADSTVKVWDIEGGFCTHNFRGHGGIISALKFHLENNRWTLISGADDCNIRIWDLQERKCVAVLKSHVSVIRGLDMSNDGRFLISGSRDKVVNIWDFDKKILLKTFPIFETIETLGVLQLHTTIQNMEEDFELFYTGGDKGIIRIWDIKTGKLIQTQEPEKNTKHVISDIIYLRKSNILTAITSNQSILFYQITSGLKRVKQIVGYNEEVIDLTYVGKDETHLAIATNTEQINLYNIKSFDFNIIYGHVDIVICLDKSYDGTVLISGSKDHTARIWSIDVDNENSDDSQVNCLGVCIGHTAAIGTVAFSKKSLKFCLTGSQDRTIKYWDLSHLDRSRPDENFRPKVLYTNKAHDKDINSIAVAPNDKIFATGSQDKSVKIWSVNDGKLLGTCSGHKRGVWSVQFSPVDQTIVTSSGDKTIKIWSTTNFSCLKTFEGHTNTVLKASFLTSGTQLISCGSDGLLKLWTIKSNECITTLDNHTEKIWALTVRKDENVVVSGGADSLINLWEDCTVEEMEKRVREEEEQILKEQNLANYLLKKDYQNAITLAMSLNQPFRLLNLFTEILDNRAEGDISITGSESIDKIIVTLSKEDIEKMLQYIRDWNTNAKHFRTAQTMLHAILKTYSSNELLEIDGIKEKDTINGWIE
ncbi:11221_t:CDS:10, partial [Cetraspora pellucida]